MHMKQTGPHQSLPACPSVSQPMMASLQWLTEPTGPHIFYCLIERRSERETDIEKVGETKRERQKGITSLYSLMHINIHPPGFIHVAIWHLGYINTLLQKSGGGLYVKAVSIWKMQTCFCVAQQTPRSYLMHSGICRNWAPILGPVITGAPEVNYSYLCLVPPIWTTQLEARMGPAAQSPLHSATLQMGALLCSLSSLLLPYT